MDLINSFAVVTYLNDPIAKFVNELRREFTPGCPHRAHITALPPRPLAVEVREAIEHCRRCVEQIDRFQIQLNEVDLFDSTQVIKLSVSSGANRLKHLHDSLNTGPMGCSEAFEYVPHITLAQDIPADKIAEYFAVARNRWAEFDGSDRIDVESLTFVQQSNNDCWEDLAELALRPLEPVPVGHRTR